MTRAIVNSKLVDQSLATINVCSKEAMYSLSVYESLMVKDSKICYLKEHLTRLELSGKGIGFKPFSKKDIENGVKTLVKEEKLIDATIRILLLDDNNFIITHTTLPTYSKQLREKGVDTILFEGERFLPTYKTSNLLVSYVARKKAEENNCFEALLVNKDKKVLEGTRSNVYAFKDNVLYTPDSHLVLEGVTRSSIIALAQEKYKVVYLPLEIDKLLEGFYDEVCLSSTSMGIINIRTINNKVVSKTNKNSLYINSLLIEDRKLHEI